MLGLQGTVPILGVLANLADAALYLFWDHDYFMAGVSGVAAITMGASCVASWAAKSKTLANGVKVARNAKLAKSAQYVATVGDLVSDGLNFADNAANLGKTAGIMLGKYVFGGQEFKYEALGLGMALMGFVTSSGSMVRNGSKLDGMLQADGFYDSLKRLRNKSGSKSSSGALGNTGEVRYREGITVNPMEVTYEMRLNPEEYAYAVADKYGINLRGSGQEINIKFDPYHTKGPGVSRELDPTNIILDPQAFMNEEELARTISHELNHARSWLKGGRAPEDTARAAENALGDYINGGR